MYELVNLWWKISFGTNHSVSLSFSVFIFQSALFLMPFILHSCLLHEKEQWFSPLPQIWKPFSSPLPKLLPDLPRYPWKVSKVVQEASLHRGGADRRSWGWERRAPLAARWAELSGRPNWETACRGTNCRWGGVGGHRLLDIVGVKCDPGIFL